MLSFEERRNGAFLFFSQALIRQNDKSRQVIFQLKIHSIFYFLQLSARLFSQNFSVAVPSKIKEKTILAYGMIKKDYQKIYKRFIIKSFIHT